MADKNLKFLVVDDFSTMRRIVCNLLRELGFSNFDEAEDGVQALQKLRNRPFDFVVSDWNMPNMNGLELVLAIRRQKAYGEVKLMMVTTESELHQIARALAAGADEYVTKPFTPDVIVEKLELLGLPVTSGA